MGIEIERRFLLKELPSSARLGYNIQQGYLSTSPDRTVRIRLWEGFKFPNMKNAWITIKGKAGNFSRYEYEYPIPYEDGLELLGMCITPIIRKSRFLDGEWEIDRFDEPFKGLIIAEIELDSEDQKIVLPEWAKVEITGDSSYTNAGLVERAYNEAHRGVCW